MISLVKILSTSVKAGKRIAKFLRFGNADVQTSAVAAPYGVDSNPVKDMVAIYSPTTEQGQTVIIGYINKNAVAEVGALRLFSTNTQGDEQVYLYLRANGKIELAGNTDNVVRWTALNASLQQAISTINANYGTLVTLLGGVGLVYSPTPVNLDISSAKVDEVQTTS